ncbi:hypothetical protein KSK32_32300 [Micromonospora sp. WMMB482]|nr:hypothetical protein [Micromonospora sp. WMMB482]MBU8861874.1 hypothetical protein [Micromonospora sp. WMMB482]
MMEKTSAVNEIIAVMIDGTTAATVPGHAAGQDPAGRQAQSQLGHRQAEGQQHGPGGERRRHQPRIPTTPPPGGTGGYASALIPQ